MYLLSLQSAPLILFSSLVSPIQTQNIVDLNQTIATNTVEAGNYPNEFVTNNTCSNAFISPEPISSAPTQSQQQSGNAFNSVELEKPTLETQSASAIKLVNDKQCPLCRKIFSRRSNLKQHWRIHTGERPYKCTFKNCNKSFHQRHSLKDHKLIHSGEKPHLCPICRKTFRVKHNLKTHFRLHTGEKPYQCTICTKRYVSRSAYTYHLKTHSTPI